MPSPGFKTYFVRSHSLVLRPDTLFHSTLQGALEKQDLGRTVYFHVQLLLESSCIPHLLFLKFVNSGFVYFLIRRALEKQQEKLRLESVLCHPVIKSNLLVFLFQHILYDIFLPGNQI